MGLQPHQDTGTCRGGSQRPSVARPPRGHGAPLPGPACAMPRAPTHSLGPVWAPLPGRLPGLWCTRGPGSTHPKKTQARHLCHMARAVPPVSPSTRARALGHVLMGPRRAVQPDVKAGTQGPGTSTQLPWPLLLWPGMTQPSPCQPQGAPLPGPPTHCFTDSDLDPETAMRRHPPQGSVLPGATCGSSTEVPGRQGRVPGGQEGRGGAVGTVHISLTPGRSLLHPRLTCHPLRTFARTWRAPQD